MKQKSIGKALLKLAQIRAKGPKHLSLEIDRHLYVDRQNTKESQGKQVS